MNKQENKRIVSNIVR